VVAPPSRRRFPRVSTDAVVLVTTVGDADAERLARTRNVSLGGCQVVVDGTLRRGTLVQVLVRVGDHVVDALGRVVYELRQGGRVEAGIEFLYLSDGDRRQLEAVLGESSPTSDDL
jgi:c-di-GMP-binding flagellar brake protein YcgR